MINNYGLFWRREAVHWNSGGKRGSERGHLLGERIVKYQTKVVNFREQVGIYCLYDDNFRLLYAGQAGFGNATLFGRLRSHTYDHLSERWTKFSWFGIKNIIESGEEHILDSNINIDGLDLSSILDSLEGIIIVSSEPPLNRRGPNFGAARRFKQHLDLESVYPSEIDMVKQMWDKFIVEGDEHEE